ncbi:hypothetical protein FF1_043604 [Malus domestica]|uniref:Exocyst complex component EXOC6/Sec15 N-terminal domain-containing protein n=1 Tax=Malus domestica TaxID=3750 RepID=A0A498JAB6_MALDO|nr:hypothetical protein DVH24_021099 [Malus domestica]
MLQHLHHFAGSKESEIEEVSKVHYQDFILIVDELLSLLSDVNSLKSSLFDFNAKLQSVGLLLLSSLDAFIEA